MNFSDEHAVIAEGGLGFGAGAGEPFRHLGTRMRDAHALAAAAGRRLDHHRIADLVRNFRGLFRIGDFAEIAGNGRDIGCGRGLFGLDLVAHGGDGLGIRPDENDAGGLQRLGESLPLGQEAIAGMHGLGTGR